MSSRLSQILSHISPFSIPSSSQPKHPPWYHPLNPTFFLPRAASIYDSATAVQHRTSANVDIKRTYTELSSRAAGLAYFLREEVGMKKGERVAIVSPNTPMFLESFYGIAGAGCVPLCINYKLTPNEICWILEFAKPQVVLVDREYKDLVQGYKCKRIIVDDDVDGTTGEYEDIVRKGREIDTKRGGKGWDDLVIDDIEETDTMVLNCTSGTTSNPKCVETTYRGTYLAALTNIIESGLNSVTPLGHGVCKYLWTLPMFHCAGWTFPWSVTAVGGVHVCLRKIDYGEIWRYLIEEGVTHFNAAPTVNLNLLSHPSAQKLDHPVRVTVAASAPSATLFEKMTAHNLQPVHVYGLTEVYGPSTKNYYLPSFHELPEEKRWSNMAKWQGHAFLGTREARVVKRNPKSKQGFEDVVRDGKDVGEIVFRGNIVMKGYLNNEEGTKKAFEGGWFWSGDLAVIHPGGQIEIVDREKDIIISGGENISSLSVEATLLGNPLIHEVAVIPIPHEKWGERPKAVVILTPGEPYREGIEEDIRKWAKTKMAGWMVPDVVEVVEELPKTATGKVKKHILKGKK